MIKVPKIDIGIKFCGMLALKYCCIKGKPDESLGRKAWSPEKDSSAATNEMFGGRYLFVNRKGLDVSYKFIRVSVTKGKPDESRGCKT